MTTNDVDVHEKYADVWWDPNDKMYILNHFNPPRFKYFGNFIKDWKGLKVLDVGCGGGFSAEYLAKKGADVYGIDISLKLINVAKDHAKLNSLDIDYRQAEAEKLPFEDNTFDVVLCLDVLEHVSDVSIVISEVARVLKGNGFFLFDTTNKTEEAKFVMITMLEEALNICPKGTHDWNKFIEPERLKFLLKDNSFEEIEFKGFEVGDPEENSDVPSVKITDNISVIYIGKAMMSSKHK